MTFNALGGSLEANRSRKRSDDDHPQQYILKKNLIDVIKREFDLSIDINWLNKELDLGDND